MHRRTLNIALQSNRRNDRRGHSNARAHSRGTNRKVSNVGQTRLSRRRRTNLSRNKQIRRNTHKHKNGRNTGRPDIRQRLYNLNRYNRQRRGSQRRRRHKLHNSNTKGLSRTQSNRQRTISIRRRGTGRGHSTARRIRSSLNRNIFGNLKHTHMTGRGRQTRNNSFPTTRRPLGIITHRSSRRNQRRRGRGHRRLQTSIKHNLPTRHNLILVIHLRILRMTRNVRTS